MDEEVGDDSPGPIDRVLVPGLASPHRNSIGEDMDVVDEGIGLEESPGEVMGRVRTVDSPREFPPRPGR